MRKASLLLFAMVIMGNVFAQKRLVTAKMSSGIYSLYNVGQKKYMEVAEAWTAPFNDEKGMELSSTSNNPDSYFYIKKVGNYFTMQPMNCTELVGPCGLGHGHLVPEVVTHKTKLEYCNLKFEPVPGKKDTYYIKVVKNDKYLVACINTNSRVSSPPTYVCAADKSNKETQEWKLKKLSDHYAYIDPNQTFMIKSAVSGYHWDLKGDSDKSTNKNGNILWLSKKMLHTNDKRYKLKRDHGQWIYFQVQNGGRNINVDKSHLHAKGHGLELWDKKSDLKGQRFALIPTSPTTCAIITYTGLALQDIDRKV